MPRIKHLRGTFLHRVLGERFFDPRLWHWDRHGAALGLAIGSFFSVLPFPLQSIPAAAVAFMCRVNVPAALVGCWLTNPLTFVPFVYLQLSIGSFLLREPSLMAQFDWGAFKAAPVEAAWTLFKSAPLPLVVGGLALGAVLGVVVYFISIFAYDVIVAAIHRSAHRRRRRS